MSFRKSINPLFGALVVATLPLGALAVEHEEEEEAGELDETEIFFELNNTDGDLGIHALIDGDGWKRLVMEDANDRKMLKVRVKGGLRRQGLTEFFFESAEPTFDELDPAVFFARFPEGEYEVEAISLEGEELEGETMVTHLLPAPPVATLNDDIEAAEDCDAELPVIEDEDVVISWEEITMSHPELGRTNEPIEVVNYEVVVEIDDTPWKVSAILSPEHTSFEVPEEILAIALEESDEPGEAELKFEILVREESFNQTATESCFIYAGEPD